MTQSQPAKRSLAHFPLQVARLLKVAGVKHVDLYAGRNLKRAPVMGRRRKETNDV